MPRKNKNASANGKWYQTRQKGHKRGTGRSGAMKTRRVSKKPGNTGKKRAA